MIAVVSAENGHLPYIDQQARLLTAIGLGHAEIGAARLNKLFVLSAGDAAIVSPGGPIKLGDFSVPQPDLLLLKPRDDFYWGQIPTAPDV